MVVKKQKNSILLLLIYVLIPLFGWSQADYSSNEEMTKAAQDFFKKEKYIDAFPLYSQLLSLNNDDPNLNYRFGVCLLYADRSDTYAPIEYLKRAIGKIEDADLYYHLGFAYHINYFFPSAISYYKEYISRVGDKQNASFEVDHKITMCQNGMAMMKSVKDLFVLQKNEVSRQEFFRSYDLQNYQGRIIKKPEGFLNKEDKKKHSHNFIFFNSKSKEVYYSAYSKTNKNQKDLFKRVKLSEGGWSEMEKLPQSINTIYDEDYPVLMADGVTLYFCSKGHNTIGGYDIFKAVLDTNTKEWSTPENINFPFNTPLDDILFVSDTIDTKAWFASVRNCVNDKIMVYQVGIIKRPDGSSDLAAIYDKNEALTQADIEEIKEKARLDVNISDQEYEQIPTLEDDPFAASKKIHEASISQVDDAIAAKEREQQVIDSAKVLLFGFKSNMDSYDSLRQIVVSSAIIKRNAANRLQLDAKTDLDLINGGLEASVNQAYIKKANQALGQAEQLSYEAGELEAFAKITKAKTYEMQKIFSVLSEHYGNAEVAVINGESKKATQIISQMQIESQSAPDLAELHKLFDPNTGKLVNIQYPQAIADVESFTAFELKEDDYGQIIIAATAKAYDVYMPQKAVVLDKESKRINEIQQEYTQLRSELRKGNKQNDFYIQKVIYRISQIQLEAEDAFIEAHVLLKDAKSFNGNKRKETLDKANFQYNVAYQKYVEQQQLQEVLAQMETADSISNTIVLQMDNEEGLMQNAINQKNINESEGLLLSAKSTLDMQSRILDFSEQIDIQTGDLVNDNISEDEVVAYELNTQGTIVSLYGAPSETWDTLDDFSNNVKQSNGQEVFALSSEIDENKTNLKTIFEPNLIPNGEELMLVSADLSSFSTSSLLMQNTVEQIQNIETQTQELLNKRNIVYAYYEEQIKKSDSLEALANRIIHSPTIETQQLDEANLYSRESKKVLWKASVAASIVKQYDNSILSHLDLIEETKKELAKIQEIEVDNPDEAQFVYNNVQKKVDDLNEQVVDDSNYNFEQNEVEILTPEVFDKEANQEFLIEEDLIVRNNHQEISQVFKLYTPDSTPNISASVLVVTSVELENIQALRTQEAESKLTAEASHIDQVDLDTDTVKTETAELDSYDSTQDSIINVELANIGLSMQEHSALLNSKKNALVYLAEQKISESNKWSMAEIQAVSMEDKKQAIDSSKKYLQEALAVKLLAKEFDKYIVDQTEQKNKISEQIVEIQGLMDGNNESQSALLLEEIQKETVLLEEDLELVIQNIIAEIQVQNINIDTQIDSSYQHSQDLANQSVKLLSEASEERAKAERKKSAFKKRKIVKEAEEKELLATELQNASERTLQYGNDLYKQKLIVIALHQISSDAKQLDDIQNTNVVANQAVVFAQIEEREKELLQSQFSTASVSIPQNSSDSSISLKIVTNLHEYETVYLKSQLLEEQLKNLQQEIIFLQQTNQSQLSEAEKKNLYKQISLLKIESSELISQIDESVAKKNTIYSLLSVEEKNEVDDEGFDTEDYLRQTKEEITIQLNEASSLKQQAVRSNNPNTREELYNKAAEKEKIAMYYILDEFEIIAQKNKTYYTSNRLILEQLMMESINAQERELMQNIFTQIDDYFVQAGMKRDKAQNPEFSFKMKKILLQDAYSLEVKAIEMQEQALDMMRAHDIEKMLSLQIDKEDDTTSLTIAENDNQELQGESEVLVLPLGSDTKLSLDKPQQGIVYKVQFSALRELKSPDFFSPVNEISAERVSNSNFIRYFSGIFRDLNKAVTRRNELRNLSYPDAFVRRWKDGVAVSLVDQQDAQQAVIVNQGTASLSPKVKDIDFTLTDISSLSGTYYTVQVGVYSRPRTSAMIFGVNPLYHRRSDNGFWVYFSGIYKSIADANIKRDEVRNMGVKDAFVVAYTNGEEVDLFTARQNISRGAAAPPDDDIVILEDASMKIDSEWNIAMTTTNEVVDPSLIVYKVQIGVYSNPVNLSWVSSQLDEAVTIEVSRNQNGKYVYSIGSYSTETQAQINLEKVKELVSDAFVTKYQGDKRLKF